MPDIMHLVRFPQAPTEVYEALTTTQGIRSWWTGDADIGDAIGKTSEVRFYGGDKVTKLEIVELVPASRIGWEVVDSFRPEWKGTEIKFELRPDQGGSVLAFAHRGFPHADDNYAVCTTGWGIYLGRLQEYLKTGGPALG